MGISGWERPLQARRALLRASPEKDDRRCLEQPEHHRTPATELHIFVDVMSMDLLLILLILLVIVGVVGGVAFSPYVFALIIVAIVLYLLIGRGRGGAAV
jgi:hypothetical protein